MSFQFEDPFLLGNHKHGLNIRRRRRNSFSPNSQNDGNYYSSQLTGGRYYQSGGLESIQFKPDLCTDSSEKITEFEKLYFGCPNDGNLPRRRRRSQSPSFMHRHSTFSSDSDSCSSISNMMNDCLETTGSSDSDDPEEVIYPEEQLKHVREFMTRRSLRLMTEEQMSRYPGEGRGCVCSHSMDSGYKSFGASPDVADHTFDVRREGKMQPTRHFLHPDSSTEVPFSRCPITTNQRFMARYKNNSLDNCLKSSSSSHLAAEFDSRHVALGLYEAKIANRIRNQQMDAHLDHLLHLRRTLMTAIQRVESTSPRSSRDGSPVVTSRSTSPAVTVIARNMKTMTPNSSPLIACNSPSRSSSEVGVRHRRLLPTPGIRFHSSPKPFHSPQLNDIRRVIQTSKMLEEEKSGSSETSSVTSSVESTTNSNTMSLQSASDVTFSSFQDRNVFSINSVKIGNFIDLPSSAIPRSETSGYSTGKDEVEQVSDVHDEDNLRPSRSVGHFSGVSTLERNFKSLLTDQDDTRLVVDLENFNPSEVPEALKTRPNQERNSSFLECGSEKVLKLDRDEKEDGRRKIPKTPRGTGSKTLMDEQENIPHSKFQKDQVCPRIVPEGENVKKVSVSPKSFEMTKEAERIRKPFPKREPIIKLEAPTSTNALMFKCAAAASTLSAISTSLIVNSPKARTILPSSSEKEPNKESAEDVDHRKLSPPHINAILDKHLRRKKSRSACSTPKKPDILTSNQVG